jgi:GxxExxY protein
MPEHKTPEDAIAADIVKAAFEIHTTLGPGLLESVYVAALCHLLRKWGHKVETEVPVRVFFDGVDLGIGFRMDVLVDDLVVVEAKSVEEMSRNFPKFVHTYVRLAKKKLALLINFSERVIKNGITRIVNGLEE